MIMGGTVDGARIIEEDITISIGMTTAAMIQEDIMMNTGIAIGITNTVLEWALSPFHSSKEINMDSLERRLVELNQALLKLAAGQKPTPELVARAEEAVSGVTPNFIMGPGNDTVIINNQNEQCGNGTQGVQGVQGVTGTQGVQGVQGVTGTQGTIGIQGIQGAQGICEYNKCSAIVISENYQASCNNYYIGVNSQGPVTVTLPEECEDCCELIIKAEMGPPLGNRKITIITSDGALIDGEDEYVIEVPYQSIRLICRNSDWHIIGTFK